MIRHTITNRYRIRFRGLVMIIILSLCCQTIGPVRFASAQENPALPAPGTMVMTSPSFAPITLKGMTVHSDNPLRFDFIVTGGDAQLSEKILEEQSTKLVKYFLACLTLPENKLWVNLSPYEGNRIISSEFSQTEMGRDVLEQDYLLKQITASLIYPEHDLGKKFWSQVYEQLQKNYGTTNIPLNTFNKVWIVPQKAVVYEHENSAFVLESHLKVMLEEDFVSLKKSKDSDMFGTGKMTAGDVNEVNQTSSDMVRSIVIPVLEKEVNEGKNFALLRQVCNSLILATWYKKSLRQGILNKFYSDQVKTKGVDLNDPAVYNKIYEQYLDAFKQGVFNYVKEEVDPGVKESVPRRYFAGGLALEVRDFLLLSSIGSEQKVGLAADLQKGFDLTFDLDSLKNSSSGQMKNIGPRDPEDIIPEQPALFAKRNDFERAALSVAPAIVHPDFPKVLARVVMADTSVLGTAGGHYFWSETFKEWVVVINGSLSMGIQQETRFHEATEIDVRQRLAKQVEDYSEQKYHLIAAALQCQKFSKRGKLTEYDLFQIRNMSHAQRAALVEEFADGAGRQWHYEVLEQARQDGISNLDIRKIKAYEKSFLRALDDMVNATPPAISAELQEVEAFIQRLSGVLNEYSRLIQNSQLREQGVDAGITLNIELERQFERVISLIEQTQGLVENQSPRAAQSLKMFLEEFRKQHAFIRDVIEVINDVRRSDFDKTLLAEGYTPVQSLVENIWEQWMNWMLPSEQRPWFADDFEFDVAKLRQLIAHHREFNRLTAKQQNVAVPENEADKQRRERLREEEERGLLSLINPYARGGIFVNGFRKCVYFNILKGTEFTESFEAGKSTDPDERLLNGLKIFVYGAYVLRVTGRHDEDYRRYQEEKIAWALGAAKRVGPAVEPAPGAVEEDEKPAVVEEFTAVNDTFAAVEQQKQEAQDQKTLIKRLKIIGGILCAGAVISVGTIRYINLDGMTIYLEAAQAKVEQKAAEPPVAGPETAEQVKVPLEVFDKATLEEAKTKLEKNAVKKRFVKKAAKKVTPIEPNDTKAESPPPGDIEIGDQQPVPVLPTIDEGERFFSDSFASFNASWDRQAFKNTVVGFDVQKGHAAFMNEILHDFVLSLAHDYDQDLVDLVLNKAASLDPELSAAIKRLAEIYQGDVIYEEQLEQALFDLKDHCVAKGVYPFIFSPLINDIPHLFIFTETINRSLTLNQEQLDLIGKGQYAADKLTAVFVKGDKYPFKGKAGYFEGQYAIVFQDLVSQATDVPAEERENWTAFHELLHALEQLIYQQEGILQPRNMESNAVLAPLFWSEYNQAYQVSVISPMLMKKDKNSYYTQAARWIDNGQVQASGKEAPELDLVTNAFEDERIAAIQDYLSGLSIEESRDLAVELYLHPMTTAESGYYPGSQGEHEFMKGVDGRSPRSRSPNISSSEEAKIKKPGIEYQRMLDDLTRAEVAALPTQDWDETKARQRITELQNSSLEQLGYHELKATGEEVMEELDFLQRRFPTLTPEIFSTKTLLLNQINEIATRKWGGLLIFRPDGQPQAKNMFTGKKLDYNNYAGNVETLTGFDRRIRVDYTEDVKNQKLVGEWIKGTKYENQEYSYLKICGILPNGDWLAVVEVVGGEKQLIGPLAEKQGYAENRYRFMFMGFFNNGDFLAVAELNNGKYIALGPAAEKAGLIGKEFKDLRVYGGHNNGKWLGTAQLENGKWIFVGNLFQSQEEFLQLKIAEVRSNGDWLATCQRQVPPAINELTWKILGSRTMKGISLYSEENFTNIENVTVDNQGNWIAVAYIGSHPMLIGSMVFGPQLSEHSFGDFDQIHSVFIHDGFWGAVVQLNPHGRVDHLNDPPRLIGPAAEALMVNELFDKNVDLSFEADDYLSFLAARYGIPFKQNQPVTKIFNGREEAYKAIEYLLNLPRSHDHIVRAGLVQVFKKIMAEEYDPNFPPNRLVELIRLKPEAFLDGIGEYDEIEINKLADFLDQSGLSEVMLDMCLRLKEEGRFSDIQLRKMIKSGDALSVIAQYRVYKHPSEFALIPFDCEYASAQKDSILFKILDGLRNDLLQFKIDILSWDPQYQYHYEGWKKDNELLNELFPGGSIDSYFEDEYLENLLKEMLHDGLALAFLLGIINSLSTYVSDYLRKHQRIGKNARQVEEEILAETEFIEEDYGKKAGKDEKILRKLEHLEMTLMKSLENDFIKKNQTIDLRFIQEEVSKYRAALQHRIQDLRVSIAPLLLLRAGAERPDSSYKATTANRLLRLVPFVGVLFMKQPEDYRLQQELLKAIQRAFESSAPDVVASGYDSTAIEKYYEVLKNAIEPFVRKGETERSSERTEHLIPFAELSKQVMETAKRPDKVDCPENLINLIRVNGVDVHTNKSGSGMEFYQVEKQQGLDDHRRIEGSATARTGKVHVIQTAAEVDPRTQMTAVIDLNGLWEEQNKYPAMNKNPYSLLGISRSDATIWVAELVHTAKLMYAATRKSRWLEGDLRLSELIILFPEGKKLIIKNLPRAQNHVALLKIILARLRPHYEKIERKREFREKVETWKYQFYDDKNASDLFEYGKPLGEPEVLYREISWEWYSFKDRKVDDYKLQKDFLKKNVIWVGHYPVAHRMLDDKAFARSNILCWQGDVAENITNFRRQGNEDEFYSWLYEWKRWFDHQEQAAVRVAAHHATGQSAHQSETRDQLLLSSDTSQVVAGKDLGGIDLDSGNLDLEIKNHTEGAGFPLPDQALDAKNLVGFQPILIDISPVTDIPALIGAQEEGAS